MKKIFAIIILITIFAGLFSCDNGEAPADTPIAVTMLDKLTEYYQGQKLTGYRELAAFYYTEKDLTRFDFSAVLKSPETTVPGLSNYLLSVAVLRKAGLDNGAETIEYAEALAELLASPAEMYTKNYILGVLALYAVEYDFDIEKAVTETIRRRKGTGYCSRRGGETPDSESTAYVFTLYAAFPDALNGEIYDETLLYLGNMITDINTLENYLGQSSCKTTAIVLNSIYASGIPIDGEISTKLLTAIDNFAETAVFAGYPDIKGESPDAETTAEVLLCAASGNRGNVLLKLVNTNLQ